MGWGGERAGRKGRNGMRLVTIGEDWFITIDEPSQGNYPRPDES